MGKKENGKMKKILTTVAVVAVATCVHAASFNWSMTNIMQPTDSSAMASVGWVAGWYDNSNGTTLATVTSLLEAGKLSEAYAAATYKAATSALGTAQVRVASNGNGSYSTGETATGFMIVFNASDAAEASYYIITDSKTSGAVNAAGSNISLAYGKAENYGWTSAAVPEPTSGLLMLLGMAGLALKRKRA